MADGSRIALMAGKTPHTRGRINVSPKLRMHVLRRGEQGVRTSRNAVYCKLLMGRSAAPQYNGHGRLASRWSNVKECAGLEGSRLTATSEVRARPCRLGFRNWLARGEAAANLQSTLTLLARRRLQAVGC